MQIPKTFLVPKISARRPPGTCITTYPRKKADLMFSFWFRLQMGVPSDLAKL